MSAAATEVFESKEYDLEDLTASELLDVARANEAEIRQREVLRLRIAYQWAVSHPPTDDTGYQTLGGAVLKVLHEPDLLGGEGTPPVAAFTHETLAATLALTPNAGAALIGDALDLHHRLPGLWGRVQALEVPAWQARRVATQTRHLPLTAAWWVDEQLAARTDGSVGPVITDRLIAQATAALDPEAHADREDADTAGWDVALSHPAPPEYTGSSYLTVSGDTPTLSDFHQLVATVAHQLRAAGDTTPLGVRKITALRIITRLAAATLTGQQAGDATPELSRLTGLEPEALRRIGQAVTKHGSKVKLIVGVDGDDLEATNPDLAGEPGDDVLAVGRIERLGAATIARLREWVGHHQVQILPVLNTARRDAVDQHDPPEWMRELVILRDRHCIFPFCTVDARSCDLDHEDPYQEGGPPGQTHPDGLACLCRRHHRAKTSGAWRYTRTSDGYLWFGPHHTRFLRTARGTRRV